MANEQAIRKGGLASCAFCGVDGLHCPVVPSMPLECRLFRDVLARRAKFLVPNRYLGVCWRFGVFIGRSTGAKNLHTNRARRPGSRVSFYSGAIQGSSVPCVATY